MAFSRRVAPFFQTSEAADEAALVLPEHPYPEQQRSKWLPAGAWQHAKEHPVAKKYLDLNPDFAGAVPPEAPFCWCEADYRMFIQSSGFVLPKLKLLYYMSPECPQTIVDLVAPVLGAKRWACTVETSGVAPPIFVWEGSRRSIDPGPTLKHRGLVNRVAPLFPITTKVGMLEAVRGYCKACTFPPPWYPRTFRLPEELDEWREHLEANPETRWIYKPNGGARGIGIILVSQVSDVDSPERPFASRCRPTGLEDAEASPLAERFFAPSGILQEYVRDLRLIDGRKFAVRVYVLIARVEPLLVFVHGAAYAKVCGMRYDADSFSQMDLFRHVTEQEFQKKGKQVFEDWQVIPVMTLAQVDEALQREAHTSPEAAEAEPWSVGFRRQVRRICTEVVASFREQVRAEGQLGMFEILGFDFICRADGSVMFLEANRDPSWVVDNEAKRSIIPVMVPEMLDLVLRAHGEGHGPVRPLRREGTLQFEVLIDEECGVD